MFKLKYFLLIISLVFLSKFVLSQDVQEFTTAADTFLIRMSDRLLATKNKHFREKSKTLLESFSFKWTSGRFSKNQKQHIYFIESQMKEKRMKTYPYYFVFIKCLDGFISIVQPEESVLAWLKSLEDLIPQRTNKKFLKYLQQTDDIFSGNYLHYTKSYSWHFNNGKFYFKYDSIPSVVFEKLDLICATKNDSSEIKDTKGVFYPYTNNWVGEKGKLSWVRVGFDKDDVYALLNDYNINLSETVYSADSVRFVNNLLLKNSIGGSLSERVLSSPPNSRTSYPRFDSYFKGFEIKNIFENINFSGGFSVEGANLIGLGNENDYATIELLRNDKRFALIKSKRFLIKTDRIVSDQSYFSIYHNNDSIFHSSSKMKYDNDDKELVLMRARYPSYSSPFNDSFHDLDLYCEIIKWKMNEPNIYFEMIKGVSNESNAYFMSKNHYSDHDYYKLQGIDPVNPINIIKKYSKNYNTRKVRVNTLADFINKPKEQAVAMIMRLANKGLVVYNVEKKEAFIKDRLFDFLDAKAGLIDYDVIKFNSATTFESNAELNINNFDLTINGVSHIILSDSQRVYVFPDENRIVMKENRDFVFSGRVHAGLFDFYAHECSFEYDTFRLNLPRIDSISFAVKYHEKDEFGRQNYIRVKNVIANLSGDILIDDPQNKSGKKNFSRYPVFNSPNDSYVYFHYSAIKNGVYDKERFFYHVSPFEIDSLVDFSTDGLNFNGYLASNGMFPEFEEPLVVMPDYSLGFIHQIPEKGYPVYNNKGNFFNRIIMNNMGLNGEGTLNYLTSLSSSKDYSFYPDSLIARCNDFQVLEFQDKPQFPSMITKIVDVLWLPDTNNMYVTMIKDPFLMFNNGSEFEGNVELSPLGAKGNGIFNFSNAQITSSDFDFYHHEIYADTSDFELLTKSGEGLAIQTHAYSSNVDFEKRSGWFKTNGRTSKVDLPFNQYICFMDEMEWDMDNNMMILKNNTIEKNPELENMSEKELIDVDLSGSEFVSVGKDQDSLSFTALSGKYDMTEYIVYAEGVKVIKVADAAIFPGDGKIKILKNAAIETLFDASIIADTNTKYHRFYDTDVNIYSKNNYHANGLFDYVDKNKVHQKIIMNKISVDSLGNTFAEGLIPEYSVFFLSPEYLFNGNVSLFAQNEFLFFDGGFSIIHDCYMSFNERKIKFKSVIDPENISIPIAEKMYDIDYNNINVGINYSEIENKIYPAFLGQKAYASDYSLISAQGDLVYNLAIDKYQVASKNRIEGKSLLGNYVSLSKKNCLLSGEGKINLGLNLGYFLFEIFGQINYFTIPEEAELKLVAFTDFYFDDKMLEMLSDSLNSSNLNGVDFADRNFKLALTQKIGSKATEKLILDYSLYGAAKKIPNELLHTFVFSDINFIWDASLTSFVSKGPIGIGNINREQINKYVNGYFEIKKRKTGDEINFYFELNKNQWYFFSYRNNVMQAISSNEVFNNRLIELNPASRIFKEADHEDQYEFVISTLGKKSSFVKRMKKYFKKQ